MTACQDFFSSREASLDRGSSEGLVFFSFPFTDVEYVQTYVAWGAQEYAVITRKILVYCAEPGRPLLYANGCCRNPWVCDCPLFQTRHVIARATYSFGWCTRFQRKWSLRVQLTGVSYSRCFERFDSDGFAVGGSFGLCASCDTLRSLSYTCQDRHISHSRRAYEGMQWREKRGVKPPVTTM